MKEEEKKKLLFDLKNYLDITWEDAKLDKKLEGIMCRGMEAINRKSGAEQDFLTEGAARSLLFHYAMYERSGCLHEFWENYRKDVLAMRMKEGVEAYFNTEPERGNI